MDFKDFLKQLDSYVASLFKPEEEQKVAGDALEEAFNACVDARVQAILNERERTEAHRAQYASHLYDHTKPF